MLAILLALNMKFKPQESLERMPVILYHFEICYKMDRGVVFAA